MRPIIFQVHFHGNYYAGDHIDIHDNTSVNFYQGEQTRETNTHETCVEDVVPIVEQAPCPFLVTEKLAELRHKRGESTGDAVNRLHRKPTHYKQEQTK